VDFDGETFFAEALPRHANLMDAGSDFASEKRGRSYLHAIDRYVGERWLRADVEKGLFSRCADGLGDAVALVDP